MSNTHFQFKQFRIEQARSGMKVTTDGCIFGAWVASQLNAGRVLDIGAGTGLLTLMLAQRLEGSLDAVEADMDAYEEAKENVAGSPWHMRINVHHSAIQTFQSDYRYDTIISNPPFFKENMKGLQASKNTAVHNDTLSTEDLLASILLHLSSDGQAYVMYPAREMESFTEMALEKHLYPFVSLLIRDQSNSQILRAIAGFSRKKTGLREQQLIIKNEEGVYSNEFVELLHPYYLNL